MGEPLEHAYFNWLYAKVCDVRATVPSRRFETLLGELNRIEFVWLLSGDDNRAEDGLDLRSEFAIEARLQTPRSDPWFLEACSFLEMLIALARRAAFDSGESENYWFWKMLHNIGLSEMHDASGVTPEMIHEVIDVVIWRTYDFNGGGGLFPLLRSRNDQRKVELWYQLSEYFLENDFG